MAMKQLTNILTKKPFGKAMPTKVTGIAMSDNLNIANYPDNDRVVYKIVSQADFIRELEPNGHIINDEHYYPNRIKRIPKKDFNGVEHWYCPNLRLYIQRPLCLPVPPLFQIEKISV